MNRSTPEFDKRIADWLEADPTIAPPDVLTTVVAAMPSIPQARRGLLAPWRFTQMTNFMRATAGVAIVAVVGVGVLALNLGQPGGGTQQTPGPTATAAAPPTAAPTPSRDPSEVAPGIESWTTYTSEMYGITFGYPEHWPEAAPATRTWQARDSFPSDDLPYADIFVSPGEGDAQIGLFVWEMLAGEGADLDSVQGLEAWAETFCSAVGVSPCEEFTQGAVAMCLNAGGDPCRPAILVPTAGQQYAFFMDWSSAMFTNVPDLVRVVVIARPDGFPAAARYGGSVELLKSILTTMDVHPR